MSGNHGTERRNQGGTRGRNDMSEHDGEYIELDWPCDQEFYLVRGWPGEAATRKAVEAFACNDWSRKLSFRECYAANLQTAMSRVEGWQYEVRLSDKPGRGRYKVSVLELGEGAR